VNFVLKIKKKELRLRESATLLHAKIPSVVLYRQWEHKRPQKAFRILKKGIMLQAVSPYLSFDKRSKVS